MRLLPGGRRLRVPVAQRDVRAADPRGDGVRLPGGDVEHAAPCRRPRAAPPCSPTRTTRRRSRAAIDRGRGPGTGAAARARAPAGRAVHLGARRPRRPSTSTARSPERRRAHRSMRVLVTGGAGFIGSHTCDRLLALGHDVVVLDALTPPVHRDRTPGVPQPERRLLRGRRPQPRPAREPASPCRRGLPLRRLPGLPARLLPVLRRQRGLDRADLRDHRGRAPRPRRGSSWRRRRRRWARGCTGARATASSSPACGPRRALAAGHWDIPCPVCGGPLEMHGDARAVSNPQNAVRHVEARRRRWWPSTSAAGTASRRSRCATASCRGRGSRSTTRTRGRAASSACSYLQGVPPTLYEDGEAIRDYVNIDDVVDANVLVLDDERAVGRVFNVGGGEAVTTTRVRRHRACVSTAPTSRQSVTGEYRFGDTRHILSDIVALRALGWAAAAHAGRLGRRVRRVARGHARTRRRAGRRERADARARASSGEAQR